MPTKRPSASFPRCGYPHHKGGPTCAKRGDHFCAHRADRAVAFIETICVHTKSVFAKRPFILEDWQRDDIVRPLFGTVRWDPQWEMYVRRYTIAWVELGRGNGKSELAAAIILLLEVGDDEESAEIYGAAKDTKQAGKVGEVVVRMSQLSPVLSKRLHHNKHSRRLVDEKTNSWYEVVPADAEGELGANPYGVVIDEVLAQADGGLWGAFRSAQGKRPWSLQLGFTTAGNDPEGFAADMHLEMQKVAEDPDRAPHVFVYMRNTPKEADPWDEKTWYFANPALGKFLSIETVRQEALEARNNPALENEFRQYRLNQWVQQATRYIPLDLYDLAGQRNSDEGDLVGKRCFGGLDLSATSDLTALSWFFPGKPHSLIRRFWVTETAVEKLDKATNGRFSQWVKAGWVAQCDGDVIDYDLIHERIVQDAKRFDVAVVGLDRWNSASTSNWLAKNGIEAVIHRQGFLSMSPPLKELMRMLRSGNPEDLKNPNPVLHHDGNPVSRYCADSLVVKRDDSDNVKPVKPDRAKSAARIDGMVADIMSIGCWLYEKQAEEEEEPGEFFAFT